MTEWFQGLNWKNVAFTTTVGAIVFVVLTVIVFVVERFSKQWVELQLSQLAQQLKKELPPLMIGELFLQRDFREWMERHVEVETKVKLLEQQMTKVSHLVLPDGDSKDNG